jgi:hypothetical protein
MVYSEKFGERKWTRTVMESERNDVIFWHRHLALSHSSGMRILTERNYVAAGETVRISLTGFALVNQKISRKHHHATVSSRYFHDLKTSI